MLEFQPLLSEQHMEYTAEWQAQASGAAAIV